MTDLDLRAGQIHRGLGVVARWPDIALVFPSDADHDATVDQMFHDLGPEPEAPQVVAAINELLASGRLAAVAMLVEATGGPLAMAYGPVEILVDGEQVLDGSEGGVRQQLSPSAQRLTIRAANLSKAAEPVAPYDLRRGVAPGAGLTLIITGTVGPASLDADAPAPPAPPVRAGVDQQPIVPADPSSLPPPEGAPVAVDPAAQAGPPPLPPGPLDAVRGRATTRAGRGRGRPGAGGRPAPGRGPVRPLHRGRGRRRVRRGRCQRGGGPAPTPRSGWLRPCRRARCRSRSSRSC